MSVVGTQPVILEEAVEQSWLSGRLPWTTPPTPSSTQEDKASAELTQRSDTKGCSALLPPDSSLGPS